MNLILSHAPDGAAQLRIVGIVQAMERDGMDNQFVIRALVGILHDGVAYSNWPWSPPQSLGEAADGITEQRRLQKDVSRYGYYNQ